MAYVPLARKYRPQTFDELVGQPHVTTTLARAIAHQRIGQAYLFAGQRGVGKTSAARILAKCLNCANGPTATPCRRCPICTSIQQGANLDVIEIDGASNRGIDDIRQLREQVKFAPAQGRYKIYIIDEVHQITSDAFNALLKTLEEPPAHVKFIFATTAPQKVPATILSRCQRFDFRRVELATLVSALQRVIAAERIAIDEAAVYALARAADGSLRDAEVMLEQLTSFCDGDIRESDVTQLLGTVEQDALLAWTQAIIDCDVATALQRLQDYVEQGKELGQLLISLLTHLRHLMILQTLGESADPSVTTRLVAVPPESLERLQAQAAGLSVEELQLMAQVLVGAYELARRSPFAQAIVELAVIRLTQRGSWTSIAQVMDRLEDLERHGPLNIVASAPPAPSRSSPVTSTSTTPAPPSVTPMRPEPFDQLLERWPAVLEQIGRQRMSLAAYLSEAKPLDGAGGTVRIGLPAFALHLEVLSLPDNLRLVERAMSQIMQQPVRIQYAMLPAPTPDPAATQPNPHTAATLQTSSLPPVVQDIVRLFDATVMPQPPQPS